ncbi:MAG: zinc metallopeptidase [Isosphaeraceae bacterium]
MILTPALALIVWARVRLRSANTRAANQPSPAGLEGARFAAMVLEAGGVEGLTIARADGPLADFYDPGGRSLRLSGPVFHGCDMARLGRAAYEAGHAARDGKGGWLGGVRRLLAFTSGLTATAAWLTMLAGLALPLLKLVLVGTVLLWVALLAALAEVPLGRDAARRALASLDRRPTLDDDQRRAVEAVLAAAPWTRVASLIGR